MTEIPDNTIDLIITSPPYFNIKQYGDKTKQIGNNSSYQQYINDMNKTWKESARILKPNAKIAINTPNMPMVKTDYNTHYNRDIFNINNDITTNILTYNTNIVSIRHIYLE